MEEVRKMGKRGIVSILLIFSIISEINFQNSNYSLRRLCNLSGVQIQRIKLPRGFLATESAIFGDRIYVRGERDGRDVILVYSEKEGKFVQEIDLGKVESEESLPIFPHIAFLPDGRLVINKTMSFPQARISLGLEGEPTINTQERYYYEKILILGQNGEVEKSWLIPKRGELEEVIGIETTADGNIVVGFCNRDLDYPQVNFLIYNTDGNFVNSFQVLSEGGFRGRILFTLDSNNNIALLITNRFGDMRLTKFDIYGKYIGSTKLAGDLNLSEGFAPTVGIKISPEGNLVPAFYDGKILIFDSEGRLIDKIEIPETGIYSLELKNDGLLLFTADRVVELFH